MLVHEATEKKRWVNLGLFYNKFNQIYQIIPAYDTQIMVGNFNVKIGREWFFKPIKQKWSLHKISIKMGLEQLILRLITW